MSNGHTLARTCLLSSSYLEKYPEISHPSRGRYTGRFELDDEPEGLGTPVGEALLSPTRLFSPIAAAVLREVGDDVHGMVHNTGGGQTKCLRVGGGVKYVKDNLPEPDPIFHLIQRESGVEWREMYQDFNMGVGFEFIVAPECIEAARSVAEGFGLGVHLVGRCEKTGGANKLEIRGPHGDFLYE